MDDILGDIEARLRAATAPAGTPAAGTPPPPQASGADATLSDLAARASPQYSPPPPALPPSYSGSILPFSTDERGNTRFDPNAGLVGMAKRVFQAPEQVYSGQLPVLDPYGRTSPELNNRAFEFATMANPELRGVMAAPRVAPSAETLKGAADTGYKAARASGLDIAGNAVGDMASQLQSSLTANEGIIAETAPKTFAILDKLAKPPSGGFATISGIEAARRGISNVSMEGGIEGLAASRALHRIDDFLSSLDAGSLAPSSALTATPQAVAATLRDARANYAAAQRSNDLTGTLDRATTGVLERAENRAQAANSGRNIGNTIRQRVEGLLEKPKDLSGFSDAEIEALNRVVQGGLVSNTARYMGNLLGGGGGMGQALTSGLGAAGGASVGGTTGAALGALAVPGTGALLKMLDNALTRGRLSQADEIVRMNSPLFRELQGQQPLQFPAVGMESAVIRSLLPGLLYPQPPREQRPRQQQGFLGPLA